MEWFSSWFDSPYYHILYQNRNDDEAREFIAKLVNAIAPKKRSRMLDLACGKGRHSIFLANQGYDVTGLDLSPQSIEYAQQFEKENLSFFVHDMRKPFRSNYYDYIFNFFTSFGYFENKNDNISTLISVKKGLRKEGVFVMDFMNAKKVKTNLIPKEEKILNDITFNIRKNIEKGKIIKDIRFSDLGRNYHFQEKVSGFELGEMEIMFRAARLKITGIYGNYDLSDYDEDNSDRLILIAEHA